MSIDLSWRLGIIFRQLGKIEIVEKVYDSVIFVERMGFYDIVEA